MKLLTATPGFFESLNLHMLNSLPESTVLIEAGCKEKDPNGLYISGREDGLKFIQNFSEHDLPNLFQSTSPFFLEDLFATCTIQKGAQSFFDKEGSDILSTSKREGTFGFSAEEGKDELFSGLEKIMQGHQIRSSIANEVLAIGQELFMNAAYDAVRENTLLGLIAPSHIHIDINESRIQLTCVDHYGSLQIQKFVKRVKEVYIQGARDAMNWGDGGAGLGSTILLNKCSRLFMGVQPGKKTVVSCAVPIRMSLKEQEKMGRCFFSIESLP